MHAGVLLSIIAGKRVEQIQEKFNTKLVIRTMPNTPAAVMEGMTVWFPAAEVPEAVVEQAKQMLDMTGTALLATAENILDMVSDACSDWCCNLCSVVHI
jgi:pyrroline-5-carboxylate reductase